MYCHSNALRRNDGGRGRNRVGRWDNGYPDDGGILYLHLVGQYLNKRVQVSVCVNRELGMLYVWSGDKVSRTE